jgi:Tol biopolymer transport system component
MTVGGGSARLRRRLLLGALGVACAVLAAACGEAASVVPTVSPGVGSPVPASPLAPGSPAPAVGAAAPGPIATSVQIVQAAASSPGPAGAVGPAQSGPPLLVPGRQPSPSSSGSLGASPGPIVLASPAPLPVVLERPGLLAVADGGRIVLVDPAGQLPHRVLAGGPDDGEPRWSPDGRQLIVTGGYGPAAELFLLPAAGGPPQHLTSNARQERGAVWSPRGDRIAYVLSRSSGPSSAGGASGVSGAPDLSDPEEVWLLDLATGVTAKLTDGFDPSWSPDGQRLAYATNGQRDGQGARGNAVHVVGADGQGDRPVLAVADVPADFLPVYGLPFKPAIVRLRAPSWSPDGTRLVASADGHTSMALTFAERGPDRDIRPWALAYEGGVGRGRWSPDGQRLAVESRPATGVDVVVLIDLAARRESAVGGPRAGFQASAPTWAADGQSLALVTVGLPSRRGEPREMALRVFSADGTARETLLTAPSLSTPDWGRAP